MTTASEKQRIRSEQLRHRLLQNHGAVDVDGVAALRDMPPQDVAITVAELVEANRLFTVHHAGKTLYPLVQFNDDGSLNEQIAHMVSIFLDNPNGKQGWALWAWLCVPTGLLSGEIPSAVVENEPDRAFRAAERSAAVYTEHERPGRPD